MNSWEVGVKIKQKIFTTLYRCS